MAQLTVQTISHGLSASTGVYSGLTPALTAAAAAGDTFRNADGRTFLRVKNAAGAPITVTVNAIKNCNQGYDHNVAISVTNAEERWIGPFNPQDFNDANELVSVTYSSETSVTVGAFSLASAGRP